MSKKRTRRPENDEVKWFNIEEDGYPDEEYSGVHFLCIDKNERYVTCMLFYDSRSRPRFMGSYAKIIGYQFIKEYPYHILGLEAGKKRK